MGRVASPKTSKITFLQLWRAGRRAGVQAGCKIPFCGFQGLKTWKITFLQLFEKKGEGQGAGQAGRRQGAGAGHRGQGRVARFHFEVFGPKTSKITFLQLWAKARA